MRLSFILAAVLSIVALAPLTSSAQQNQSNTVTNAPSPVAKSESVNQPLPVSANNGANERLSFMNESQTENREQAPSAIGLLLRTIGALLLIVGLIVAAAWGMKRFGGARFGAPKADAPELAVLNSIGLGERRSLAIVRFGERTLLIGSTPQTVTLIAENTAVTPRAQSVAEILNESTTNSFADELSLASQNDEDQEWVERVEW